MFGFLTPKQSLGHPSCEDGIGLVEQDSGHDTKCEDERPSTGELSSEGVKCGKPRRPSPLANSYSLCCDEEECGQEQEQTCPRAALVLRSRCAEGVCKSLDDDGYEEEPNEERGHDDHVQEVKARLVGHAEDHGDGHVDDECLKGQTERAHFRGLGGLTFELSQPWRQGPLAAKRMIDTTVSRPVGLVGAGRLKRRVGLTCREW